MVLWSCGPVVLWSCGPVVLWSCGPVVLWSCGPVVLTLETGLISPPVGINVFILRSVARNMPLIDIFRSVMAFGLRCWSVRSSWWRCHRYHCGCPA
ncbi:TRAP transporter large permease subunit [Paracoccus sp. T5]